MLRGRSILGGMLALGPGLLTACSSMTPAELPPAVTRHVLQKNFTVGELKSAAVGEVMLSLKDYYEKDRQTIWSISAPATLRVGLGSMALLPGDYPASRRVEMDGTSFDVVELKVHPVELTTLKPSSAEVPMTFFIDNSGQIARAGGGLGISTGVSDLQPVDFRATRSDKVGVDSGHGYTNFELLYSGTAAGAVRLAYREYAPGDSMHASRFQDLSYSLSEKDIRFKDMLLEVESADNQTIRFRVKSVPQEWTSAEAP